MSEFVDPFIRYTEELLAVARRLSECAVEVYASECNVITFGAWRLVAGRAAEGYQFMWDGRSRTFIISKAVLIDGRKGWEPVRTLNLDHPEAISAMEIFLKQTFKV